MRHLVSAVAALGMLVADAQAQGPDHIDMDAARREGTLTWYTSTPVVLAQQLAAKFEQQTGVKVQLLRSGGQAVLSRLQQEISVGRPGADVLTMSDAGAANLMAKQGRFEPFRPEGFEAILQKDHDGRWIAQRLSLIGIPVRTDKVAARDIPRTWSDLGHPKYKGLMVMPDPSFTAIQLIVVGMLSQKLGWDFYRALRANDIMIVQGHQQVFSTMQSGERVIGAEGADPRTYAKGLEVPNQRMIYPSEGVFFVSAPTAVIRGASHPAAAKAFAQFMVTRAAQAMIAESGIHAARVDIAPPAGQPALSAIKHIPIDFDYVEEHGRTLKAKFNEIFQ
jgi:iron(III) transport system substrate-binding protein